MSNSEKPYWEETKKHGVSTSILFSCNPPEHRASVPTLMVVIESGISLVMNVSFFPIGIWYLLLLLFWVKHSIPISSHGSQYRFSFRVTTTTSDYISFLFLILPSPLIFRKIFNGLGKIPAKALYAFFNRDTWQLVIGCGYFVMGPFG